MTNWTPILYLSTIFLTVGLTGGLALYAWRRPQAPGYHTYGWMSLSLCLTALMELLSMLAREQSQALFWFNLRFLFISAAAIFWLAFSLEYNGLKEWASTQNLIGLSAIPFIIQILLWTNDLHQLWVRREAVLYRSGFFWLVDLSARIPSTGFMALSFYGTLLFLVGGAITMITAWHRRSLRRPQILSIAAVIMGLTGIIIVSVFSPFPKHDFNGFTPLFGVGALLYALMNFRSGIAESSASHHNLPGIRNLEPYEKRSLTRLLFIFTLFAASIATINEIAYRNYELEYKKQMENQLAAIAALKADEVQGWRDEKLLDARLFHHNKNFSKRVEAYLKDDDNVETRDLLLEWIKKVKLSPEYDRIFLLDAQGNERVSIPDTPEIIPNELKARVLTSLALDEIVFLDFHRHFEADKIHLSLIIPIFDEENQPLGVLVLRINPEQYLYPFIQRWPIPSSSAETLLVRREGNEAVYLNELRFDRNAALNLRISLENKEVSAVKAALGMEGITKGVDYRGVEVISDIRAIPDSSWFLISEIDATEAYAPLWDRMRQAGIFFYLLIIIAGGALALAWRQQQTSRYRSQIETLNALRVSEEKFKLAFDTSPDSLAITRAKDGMFLLVNKGFEQITGYNREEIIGKTSFEFNIWKDPKDRQTVVEKLQTEGEVRNYEAPFLTRSGEIHGLMSAVLIQLNGEPHILNITRDITERKAAEKALQESETRYRTLIESVGEGIGFVDENEQLTFVNPAGREILGLPLNIPIEHNLREFTTPEQFELLIEQTQNRKVGRKNVYEMEIIRADGEKRHMLVTAVPQFDNQGQFMGTLGTFRDLTERKLVEEKITQAEKHFQALIENAPDGIVLVGLDGKYKYASPSALKIFGHEAENTFSHNPADDIHPDDFPIVVNVMQNLIENPGVVPVIQYRLRHKNGAWRWIDSAFTNLLSDPSVQAIVINFRDVTESKQAETKLRESEEQLRIAHDAAELGAWQEDLVNHVFQFDKRAQQHYDLNEASLPSRAISSRVHTEDASRLRQEIAASLAIPNSRLVTEYRVIHKDGSIHWLAVHARLHYAMVDGKQIPVTAVGTSQDITRRKNAEEQLLRRTQQLRLINEATRKLNASLKARHIYEVIYSSISQLIPCDTLFVSSFDADSQMIKLVSGWHDGKPMDTSRYEPIPLEPEGSGVQSQSIRTQEAQLISDFQARLKNTRVVHNFDENGNFVDEVPEDADIPRSALVVPLLIEGRVTGVIQVFSYRANAYTEDDLQTLNGFCVQVSVSLSNALLYEYLQRENLERKQAEEALQESQRRMETLLSNLPGMAFRCKNDPKWTMEFVSGGAYLLTGYRPADLIDNSKKAYGEVIHPQDRQTVWTVIQQQLTQKQIYQLSYRIITTGGEERWVWEQGQGVYDTSDGVIAIEGFITDITERKRAEKSLQESEQKYRLLFDEMLSGLAVHEIICDEQGKPIDYRFIAMNTAFEKMTGLDSAVVIGKTVLEVLPATETHWIERYGAVALTRAPIQFEDYSIELDKYFEVRAFSPEKGKFATIFHDITERKKAAENVQQRMTELELLYENSLAFNQSLNPNEIVQKVIELLSEKLDWHHTAIRLFNAEESALELAAFDLQELKDGENKDLAHLSKIITRVGEGLSGWALQQSKTVRIDDVENDPHYVETYPGIHSGLYVPLKSGDHILGVISTESEKPSAFSESDEQFITTLANQAAVALENARLYREISRHAEELERRVCERTSEIESTRQRLELAAKTAGIGIWELDIKKNTNYWDDRLFALYGLSSETSLPIPETWHNAIHPDDLEQQVTLMNNALRDSKPYNTEFRAVWPDGSIHHIKSTGIVIYDSSGAAERMIGANQDITIHKQAEEALSLANAEMERSLRMKTEFLATMSHELRTPLNSILGISESLEEQISGSLNDKQIKYIRVISESGRHLLDLINDILDLSKIEAGKLELNIQTVAVEKLCTSSLRMIKELAQKKNLHVSLKIDEDLQHIVGDERRLKQSLVNLLSNAVKFTPSGREIGLEAKGNAEANEVTFIVWDKGIGIDQEEKKNLFQPFVQLKSGLAREYGGTGLGLALVAQMIRLHGGHITLESKLGEGSRFAINLPWSPSENRQSLPVKFPQASRQAAPHIPSGAKVLIVEDTEVVAQLISDYLRHKGYTTFVANNGREGVLLAQQEHPQVILMDIMMPVMNGLEATKAIRADASLQNIRIIGLTALAMTTDREQCLAAGMNDHISKPIEMQELTRIIEHHLRQNG